jgi:hypothetical protein
MKTDVVQPVGKYVQLSALYTCTKVCCYYFLFQERNLKERDKVWIEPRLQQTRHYENYFKINARYNPLTRDF